MFRFLCLLYQIGVCCNPCLKSNKPSCCSFPFHYSLVDIEVTAWSSSSCGITLSASSQDMMVMLFPTSCSFSARLCSVELKVLLSALQSWSYHWEQGFLLCGPAFSLVLFVMVQKRRKNLAAFKRLNFQDWQWSKTYFSL